MSLSPASILTKLDELKKWQQQQQERLQSQTNLTASKSNPSLDLVVKEPCVPKPAATKKPKQPFLKRGAGLSRFRMYPGEQFKPFTKKSTLVNVKPTTAPVVCSKTSAASKAKWEVPCLDNTDRELRAFEVLEERVTHSSFSSTNSSIINLLASTPQKQLPIINETSNDHIDEYEEQIQKDYFNLIEQAFEFKQYVNNDTSPTSSLSSIVNELPTTTYNDENHWTEVEMQTTASSSSSCISEKVRNVDTMVDLGNHSEEDIRSMQNVETMTDLTINDEEEINHKLESLESQLKLLHVENINVKKLKDKYEQQTREFERYKKEILKHIEDEKVIIATALEEERKKLAKEKMVFERYVKDQQNKPTRKEREEISALKIEVATLQETLKMKESKHGTTQARLRNQIKNLEKENANLKMEIENINKQHAKLIVTEKMKRKPSNTKLLHEINKNLSQHLETLKENILPNPIPSPPREEKNDRTEQTLSDGSKQIKYSNGNVKTTSPDGNVIIFQYFNGDIKETNLLEGTIRYHHFENKVNHTTNSDGTEVIQFPDGQIERRLQDGVCEIEYPDGIKRKTYPNSDEQIFFPDGTVVNINKDGQIMTLPNGQREIHTNEHKRREYPDGTVKILYPDGTQETRYSSGRVRLKDKYGKLVMDSQVYK